MKIVVYFISVIGSAFVACAGTAPTPEQKHTEARASYEGMLANCVAEAKAHMPDESAASKAVARNEYDTCKDGVVARWAVDGGVQ